MRLAWLLSLLLLASCAPAARDIGRPSPGLTIAAAANLTEVFQEIGTQFTRESGVPVKFSFASTAQLARQIENGAPFDVFAAADVEHVDQLIRSGKLLPDSRALYARGILALWLPKGDPSKVHRLENLTDPAIRFIAIAQPDAAPYGKAAVETLRSTGLWPRIQSKVVYASNISMARQFAASGNADAAFTALSLVQKEKGVVMQPEENLHAPIDQALAILSSSANPDAARQFAAFVTGATGGAILRRYGYQIPKS